MSTRSPDGFSTNTFPYEDFVGLDDSRDISSMDTGKKQALIKVQNGFCDWRGNITRSPGATQITPGDKYIQHVAFYGVDRYAWAQRDGGGITLKAAMTSADEVYPPNSVVASTIFNRKLIFFSQGQTMRQFDGIAFSKIEPVNSKLKPAIGVAIQNRLATAGSDGRQGIVDFSRVNDASIYAQDEDASLLAVTKAADLDIRNIIGTADDIKGFGVLERNRLAIFTNDQTVVYAINPDFTKWAIDDKGAVGVGTLSHNTVKNAGVDILFCSRFGVYSLRRSVANGVTLYAAPLSSKIDITYRALVKSVSNPEDISAFYDQDNSQYHIFFPRGLLTTCLTMTVSPIPDAETKWSTANYISAVTGASLGGTTLLGTTGGIWSRGQIEDDVIIDPVTVVETPILWNGSITDYKDSVKFIMQAAGTGSILVESFNEENRPLSSWTVSVSGDDSQLDIPLSKQYERKFEHRYKGVRFRFTITGDGLMRIIGFATVVRSN
jgi:hypothetical protein